MHILVNDFIGGVLDRGIPLYVRNLVDGLCEEGIRVTVVRAPAWCRKLRRDLFYLFAVLIEQTVLPVLGFLLRADVTIYPYNSVAIADLLTGRGRIVVHDLEPLNRRLSFSKVYYLFCYRALKWRKAPLFTISELTRQRLLKSGLFGNGSMTILPNTFYAFERLVAAGTRARRADKSILLCTGSTANKDLDTVVSRYLPGVLAAGFCVSIVGLHKASDAPKLASLESFLNSGQLRICGRLSDQEVADAYLVHAIVWVHSLREGFGRCVIEGRLAGSRVICTDIPEFAGLRDGDVYLYKDAPDFMTTLDRLANLDAPIARYAGYPYRELLSKALQLAFPVSGATRNAPRSPSTTPVR